MRKPSSRSKTHKFIFCSGKRERTDGYKTDKPTPDRYVRLYDLRSDPGEMTDIAGQHPRIVAEMQQTMLERFRSTHPESSEEPKSSIEESLDWYVRPRDAGVKPIA